jgi:HSP20 family protein
MSTLLAPFAPFQLDLARQRRVAAPSGVPFDAVRTDAALELSFDLPGYAPADVDLSVDRNVLTLTAERSVERPEGASVLVAERRVGKVRRQLRLSDSLDLSSVEARFDNGVLSVRIPVAEVASAHKVEIAVGADPLVEAAAVESGDAEVSEN